MNLKSGEVHIWSAAIDERYNQLLVKSFLSINEKRRASKYSYDIDSFFFSVRHNLLRIILGQYLNCDPSQLRFNSNHYQKPHIYHPNSTIQFNISFSSNRFVAVFCQRQIIGVDLEIIRPIEDIKQLTTDYFTAHEAAWVYTHPEEMLEKVFFNVWAKKEAVAKAVGKGLNIELNSFDVLEDKSLDFGGNIWNIIPLKLFDDCEAAFAINSLPSNLIYHKADELL